MSYKLPKQTNITHSIRRALGISYEEYAIADAINFICNNQDNKAKKAEGKYRELIADFAGVSTRTVDRAILNLVEKKILRQPSRQSVEMAPLWEEINSDKDFKSRHFGVSENNTTHDILASHSRHFGVSVYIYIHKKHKICPKPPFLTNFSTSFLNDFSILGFEAPTISFDSSKISQKGAREAAKDKNSAKKAAALFAEFWAEYPRKEKKAAAQTKYKKLAPKHKDIMAALAIYRQKTENTETQYIKLPTTFLTDYEDYLPSESDLFASSTSSKISQKGGGDVYPDDDEELTAAKSTLRVLAVAIGKAYPDTQDQIKRVSGSAFALVDSDGNRIFDDKAAAWVEEMGGTWAAILELNGPHFDARSAMAWRNAISKTA